MNIFIAILLLGIIIFIHELGHFLLAKKNGITVTEFSLGMGPRLASFVKNGTRYSLKILPIGGSCMMLGEDEDIEDEGAFHKKGVWARFSVIFAGAFFNFVLAFVLAVVVIGAVGVDYPDVITINEESAVYEAGIREGDRIKSINGKSIHFGREIELNFFFNPVTGAPIDITYERDNKTHKTTVYPKPRPSFYKLGIQYSNETPEAELLALEMGFPFYEAGIVAGDVVTKINGTPIVTGKDMADYFDANPLTENALDISYRHDGEERTVRIEPRLVENNYELGRFYNVYRDKVSPIEAVKNSFFEVKYNISYTIQSIKYLVSGKADIDQISGPVGIVSAVGNIVDQTEKEGAGIVLLNLANFATLLSANLGVMNLLPFPALDGGRLVFLIIEAIRRKPIPKEKEAMVHFVGLALLMILMVVVLYNDIRKLF
ncbi:MAG: RIP metalloprotease RseP [Anaerolineaceae bacterium]|nr:MAG: RIP metalloprotease RseP [Anaerolineaceae bacterium]